MKSYLIYFSLLALLTGCTVNLGGGSDDSGDSSSSDDYSSWDEPAKPGDIAKAEVIALEENTDADADNDVLEFSSYFEGPNGEMIYNPGRDWTMSVTIYDSEDSNVKGDVLFEKTYSADEVMYDSVDDPYVRVALEDIKDGKSSYGWSFVKFSSPTHGDFESIDDFTTIP